MKKEARLAGNTEEPRRGTEEEIETLKRDPENPEERERAKSRDKWTQTEVEEGLVVAMWGQRHRPKDGNRKRDRQRQTTQP